MASPREEQNNLLAYLDGIMSCIENYPTFNLETPFMDKGVGVNAMSLLMLLLGKFYTQEEIIEWLANYLVYSLPVIEMGIKGVLLSNLKLSISCNVDPWIPEEWRQYGKKTNDSKENIIPISCIDYRNILQINPVSELGKEYYYKTNMEYTHVGINEFCTFSKKTFGEMSEEIARKSSQGFLTDKYYNLDNVKVTGDIETLYSLARAEDMNAFIWFVMNKGLYTNITRTNINGKLPKNSVVNSTKVQDFSANNISIDEQNEHNIYLSGDIVSTQNGEGENSVISNNYLLCYYGQKKSKDNESISYFSHLIPCSNQSSSYNWYVDRTKYGSNLVSNNKIKTERNYENEFPLFNLSYTDSSGNSSINRDKNSYLKFQVLPKPMIHYLNQFWTLEKNEVLTPLPFVKILFDKNGIPDKKGHFTVQPMLDDSGKIIREFDKDNNTTRYRLKNSNGDKTPYYLNVVDPYRSTVDNKLESFSYNIREDGKDEITDMNRFINDCLVQCYPGLTVYEFNYDFVMGMRLFDSKTVAYRIIKTLTNFRVDANAKVSMTESIYQMRISEIIKNIIEADAYEVSDCFFSFSNENFTSMLEESEKKRQER